MKQKKTDWYILHENRFSWFICDEFVGLVYVRLTVLHKLRNTNNPWVALTYQACTKFRQNIFPRYFIATLSSIAACLQTTVFACFAGREATSSWVACCLSFCVQNLSARFTEKWTDFNRAEMGSSSYSKLSILILTLIPKVGALCHFRFYSHEHIGNC